MTDRERTVAAAIEAVAGAVMAVGGLLLTRVHGADVFAIALIGLGASGLAHAVALGLGITSLPGEQRRDRERE
jgi:hypothetical protein